MWRHTDGCCAPWRGRLPFLRPEVLLLLIRDSFPAIVAPPHHRKGNAASTHSNLRLSRTHQQTDAAGIFLFIVLSPPLRWLQHPWWHVVLRDVSLTWFHAPLEFRSFLYGFHCPPLRGRGRGCSGLIRSSRTFLYSKGSWSRFLRQFPLF